VRPETGGNIPADTVFSCAFSSTSPLLLQTDNTTRIHADDASGHVGTGFNLINTQSDKILIEKFQKME